MKEDRWGPAAWLDGDMAAAPILSPAPSVTDTRVPVGVLSAEEGSVMATPRDPSARSLPLGVQCHQQPPSYSLSAQGLLSGAHKSPGPDAQSRYLPALPPALVPRGGPPPSAAAPPPKAQRRGAPACSLMLGRAQWRGGHLAVPHQQPGDE